MPTEIPLTQGYVAIVDDDDAALVRSREWHVLKTHRGKLYAVASVRDAGKNSQLLMHRLLLGLSETSTQGDHRDGNGLNNQRHNLRVATNGQNSMNRSPNRNKANGFKGVRFRANSAANPWQAYIKKDRKQIWLGCYPTAEAAALAYDTAALQLFGEFAKVNLPGWSQ